MRSISALFFTLFATALFATAFAQAGPPDPPPSLPLSQTCAAVLRDDFRNDQWNKDLWTPWKQDNNLRVYCKDDALRVTGTSGDPVPVCTNHHEFRFTGLVSRQHIQRDVVLACDMTVLAPLPTGPTRARYLVHLCGANPDYFFDTGLGHEPDGRNGWMFVPIGEGYPFSHDHQWPFRSLDEIPPEGLRTIVTEHDAATKATRAYVVSGSTWHPLGEHRVFLTTTQVEIKVDVPYDGIEVDVAYDNVRIYPRPQNAPARFVLIRPPFPGFPLPNARVTLLDTDGEILASGTSDSDGEAALTLPADRLYPLGGTLRIEFNGEIAGEGAIKAGGVEGLYPGDIWRVSMPDRFREERQGYPPPLHM